MERRSFFGRILAVGVAAVTPMIPARPKPIVRLPTDCDLSVSALQWDETFAGLVIDATLQDVDDWYLEGSRAIVSSAGA